MPAQMRIAFALAVGLTFGCCPSASHAAEPTLAEATAALKIPPDWMADQPVHYDTSQPWKVARKHIRKLLARGKMREAMKLTYDYLVVRKVQKDQHEYPMYLYLGGEYAWAIKIYKEHLKAKGQPHAHESRCLASCYAEFGEHEKALAALRYGLKHLPKPPWGTMAAAGVHDQMGDVQAARGDKPQAKTHYRKAIAHYRRAKPKYGRHLLPRRIAKVQSKLDLLEREAIDLAKLRDGVYRGKSLGYVKDVWATVTLKAGRITDIKVQHQENIEQGATRIIPKRILAAQGLDVDAVTGATVTSQAIVEATYRALQKAGLK